MVESLPTARLLLLVNYRPEYQHGWGSKTYYTQLRLDALPPEGANELLLALLGTDATVEPLKPVLIIRTGGNPFFLEESVRTLVETHALVGERGAHRLVRSLDTIDMPATVQAILASRIDRLVPEDKKLLQTASVTGKDVPFTLLLAVADLAEEDLRRGLSRLQAAEFLYETRLFPDLEYTFKHALTHEVAYGSLLGERRRALHARIVDAIERLYPDRPAEHIERLAHHAVRGELWEKAVTYLPEAAAKAVGRGANPEAASCLEQALHVIDHLPENKARLEQSVDLRLELRNVLTARVVDLPRSLEWLTGAETVARRLGDQHRLARVLSHKTHSLWLIGEPQQASAAGHQALTLATAVGDFALIVAGRQYLGQLCRTQGDYPQAIALFRSNISALDGPRMAERFGMHALPAVLARGFLADCLSLTGEFTEAAMHAKAALEIAESVGHPYSIMSACGGPAALQIRQGHLGMAIPFLERAVARCRTWDIGIWFPSIAAELALAYAMVGRIAEALALLEEVGGDHDGGDHRGGPEPGVSTGGPGRYRDRARRALSRHQPAAERAGQCCLGAARAWRDRGAGRGAGRGKGHELLRAGDQPGHGARHAPPRRPLPPRPRQALPPYGQREQAREHLATATTMYREMGMTYWLEKAEAEVTNLGT